MTTKVAKWGNSLALRLPKSVTENCDLSEGSTVEIEEREGGILLKPTKVSPSLDELLAGVTRDNLHDTVDTGDSQGKEAW